VIFGVILPGGDPRRGVKGGRLTTEAGSVPGGRLCGVPGMILFPIAAIVLRQLLELVERNPLPPKRPG